MGVKPKRIYNAYPGANDDVLEAEHGIMHITGATIDVTGGMLMR